MLRFVFENMEEMKYNRLKWRFCYESIHKRKVCAAFDAGSGDELFRSTYPAERCGPQTDDFRKVSGTDYFCAEQGRVCEKYSGTAGRICASEDTGRIHGGNDPQADGGKPFPG